MKRYFLLLLLTTIILKINAQSIIEGKVVSADNQPIEFATVVVQTSDSVFVNSAYTDSVGQFKIETTLVQYRLIVQHMMYETSELLLTSKNAGTIILHDKDNMLNEVVVKGERPVVKVSNGRLTYDMQSLLNRKAVTTAYDAILELPGVIEKSGLLTLIGSNKLNIIINGKASTMSSDQLLELLKNMPSDQILSAEVMYSAPPQYHFRGAIINLVLKKNPENMLQGQVNTSYTQKHYESYSAGFNLGYATSKLSTDILYSMSQTRRKSGLDLYSKHLYNDSIYDIEQKNKGSRKNLTHNIRANVNYAEEKNELNFTYTAQIVGNVDNKESSVGNFSNSTNNKTDATPSQMHNLNLVYVFNKKLSLGVDYTYYNDKTNENYSEKRIDKEAAFLSLANQTLNRIKVSVDHAVDLADKLAFNYGAKMQYNKDHSFQRYSNIQGNTLGMSNKDTKQEEYTYSAYIGINKQFSEELSGSVSLTGEYYKLNELKQWSVFPTIDLTYVASPSNTLQLTFSADRDYPPYWALSNTIAYLNGYAQIWGNPDLQPSRNYSAQFTYLRNNKYVFTAYYNYDDKAFAQLPYQSTKDLQLIYQTTNFKYTQSMGVSASLPATWGRLNSRLTVDASYNKAESKSFHDLTFDKNKIVLYSNLDNTFNLSDKPNIKLELSATYVSPFLQGPMDLSKIFNLEAGVKWTSNNNKAVLSIKGYDLTDSWTIDTALRFANQNLRMDQLHDSRYVSATFSYKFGQDMKKNKINKVDTSRFGY